MDIQKKPDRATLKSYFVKNAIPTAGNFADLIDGLINQKDDGIAKLPGEPLSLQADVSDTGLKKVINFYKNFADPKPAWTLSLNPRVDPAKAETAKPGWSVGDADGNSKLFIDQTTGNIGVGTVDPGGYKLNVKGPALFTGNYLSVNSENAGRLRVGAAWGMPGLYSGDDGAKPLVLGVPAGQKVYVGTNTGDAFVEGGTGNSYFKGDVGIGTTGPANKLDVMGDIAVQNKHAIRGNDTWLRLNQDLKFTSGVHTPGLFAPVSLNVGGAGGWNNNPGAGNVVVKGSIACSDVISSGNVGIGTTTPVSKLDIAQARTNPDNHPKAVKGLYITGDFGADADGVEFRHSNGTQGIGFGLNTIYAAGSNANQDLNLKPKAGSVKVTGNIVVTGAITPSAGNSSAAGIQFPSNPGGGGKDAAWIRYYARSGEACTLELGVSNDTNDHIALISSGNVGSGTTEPKAKLDVIGGIFAGNSDIYFTKTDHVHSGIGNPAGYAAIENAQDYDSLMILGRAGTANGRKVRLWDYLQVNGTFVNSSDARAKQDIAELEYGLNEIMQLRPVLFNWKEIANQHKSMGLIAQEVMPILGEAVYQDGSEQDSHLSIAYNSLIPVLINAVKELAEKVEQLSGRTAA